MSSNSLSASSLYVFKQLGVLYAMGLKLIMHAKDPETNWQPPILGTISSFLVLFNPNLQGGLGGTPEKVTKVEPKSANWE